LLLVDSNKLKDRKMPDSLRNQFIVGSHIPQVISFIENGYVDAIIAAFDILRDSIRNQVGSSERIDLSGPKHRSVIVLDCKPHNLHKRNLNQLIHRNKQLLSETFFCKTSSFLPKKRHTSEQLIND